MVLLHKNFSPTMSLHRLYCMCYAFYAWVLFERYGAIYKTRPLLVIFIEHDDAWSATPDHHSPIIIIWLPRRKFRPIFLFGQRQNRRWKELSILLAEWIRIITWEPHRLTSPRIRQYISESFKNACAILCESNGAHMIFIFFFISFMC